YSWTGDLTLTGGDTVSPTFDVPDVLVDTEYEFVLIVTDNHTRLASEPDTVAITVQYVAPANQAPIADAGDDAAIPETDITYQLDGSGSYDPDSLDTITYAWTGDLPLTGADTVDPTFDVPDVAVNTAYEFVLVVNDGHARLASEPDTVVITVEFVNQPPVADAGDDASIPETDLTYQLDGTGSYDPDSLDTITYAWTGSLALDDPTLAMPTFDLPNVAEDTDYEFVLIVDDGHGRLASEPDTVVITVEFVNQPPVADAGPDASIPETDLTYQLDGSGSYDPDALDLLNFIWSGDLPLIGTSTDTPSFDVPDVTADTEYEFVLIVDDNRGRLLSEPDTVVITVEFVNQPPVADAGADQMVPEGDAVVLDGTGSFDPDEYLLTYSWTGDLTLDDPTSATPGFTAPLVDVDTEYEFVLVVDDGYGERVESEPDTVVITVLNIPEENLPPVAIAGEDDSVDEGLTYQLDGSASYDPNGDDITYSWIGDLTLDDPTSATPTFTAPEVTEDTDYEFVLTVDDNIFEPAALLITGIIDGPFTGGIPKAIELYALADIADLSIYGLGAANNGGGSDGEEFTFPADAVTGGEFIYVATEDVAFNTWFGFAPDYIDGNAPNINGDDAVELFMNGLVVDIFGDINVDGTGQPWEYLDGWVYRMPYTGPDGDTFVLGNWTYSGINALDGEVDNATAAIPFPTATYTPMVRSRLASEPDTVVITVLNVNHAPVAMAGDDASVLETEATYMLDGSASYDPDEDVITYAWTGDLTLTGADTATPTFDIPDVTEDTDYEFVLVVDDGIERLASEPDTVVITVEFVNQAPVAMAGDDASVLETEATYMLDGSASYDPDEDILTYAWTGDLTLTGADTAMPTFDVPDVTEDTDYEFVLFVDDGYGERVVSEPDTVVITVVFVNQAPIADAGEDDSVNEDEVYVLDGNGSSDPDGEELTYMWTAPAEIVLDDATSATPSFTAPIVLADTDYEIVLVVDDGNDRTVSLPDTVIITVVDVPINHAPVADAGEDQSVFEGVTVTLDGTGSYDPDEDAITYNWISADGPVLNDVSSATPSFTAPIIPINQSFDYVFILEVSDNIGRLTDTDEVVVTVMNINQAPVADAGDDEDIDEGTLYMLDGSGSYDMDSDELTYLWTAPVEVTLDDPTSATPTFTAPMLPTNDSVDLSFTLVVNDGIERVSSEPDEVVITVLNINEAPVADAGDDQSVVEGAVVGLDGSGSYDLDQDPITYLWTAPAGIVLDDVSLATPNFTAPMLDTNIPLDLVFTLVVDDGIAGRATGSDEVVITVTNINNVPVADAGDDAVIDEGTVYMLDGSGSSDADNDVLLYFWEAPDGVSLDDPNSATPSFTAPMLPTNESIDLVFSLTVDDQIGGARVESGPDEVVITVLNINVPPVADAGDAQTVLEGVAVYLDGSGSYDADADDITYQWIAPTGIYLMNATTATPSFIAPMLPTNIAVDYTFELIVDDGIEAMRVESAPDYVVITVENINEDPIADAGANQNVYEGAEVTIDASGSSDPDNDDLSYYWEAPAGIYLADPTESVQVFTAPDVTENTVYEFILTVTDGYGGEDSDEMLVAVIFVNQDPVADAGEDDSVIEGEVYQLNGSGSYDPDGQQLSYSWDAPFGINLSDDEAINPTFTAPEVDADEDYLFTLTVSDGSGRAVDEDEVVITVINYIVPDPVCAFAPIPEDGAEDVDNESDVGWTYIHNDDYTMPEGFRILMADNENMSGAFEGYIPFTGEGDYLFPHPVDFAYETQYYWQVIPTTDGFRGDAVDCPVWTFTIEDLPYFTVSGFAGVATIVDLGNGIFSDIHGDYEVVVLAGEDLSLTPVFDGFDFIPESVTFEDIMEDIVFNFEADPWCPDPPTGGLPQGPDIPADYPELSWNAPEEGVEPNTYLVTLSDHPTYMNPILLNEETGDTFYSLANIWLDYNHVYYVRVIANFTPDISGADGCDSEALEWSFTTLPDVGSDDPILPEVTQLLGNYPNPFNPETTIKFTIAENDEGVLTVFNMKGQIVESRKFAAGIHNYKWTGEMNSSGIYFYTLTSKEYSSTRKMIMLK
ncbi:PKD domain-containing protein, partial [Candidatus Cloacimonadota bacterium]